jgi:hypothetical protein
MAERPEPRGAAQAAGRVAEEVARGLQSSPMLLAVIMLNVIMIGAGIWFIQALAKAQQSRFDLLLKVCQGAMK